MTLSAIWRAVPLVAALTAISCSGELDESLPELEPDALSTASAELVSTNKVLILSSSVNNGLSSREAQAVTAAVPTWQINVVTPEQWRAMTPEQFMTYRTLIIGDAACESGEAAFQAAVESRANWGIIVDGRVAIIATNPVSNGTPQLVENAIKFVVGTAQRRTGMYISLGCAYQEAPPDTEVTLLEPFGSFKIQGVPGCASSGHMFKMSSTLLNGTLTDSSLAGSGGCVARSVFTSYPDHTFSFTALAVSTPAKSVAGEELYTDYLLQGSTYAGAPYMVVRGSMAKSAGCGMSDYRPSYEACDLGEGVNGTPAVPGQNPLSTCSFSCQLNWCGDGAVDTEFGEECDNGVYNGRTNDTLGTITACTAFCKNAVPPPPTNSPPNALCKNVAAVADYTCGVPASIDNGSFDPAGELVNCTQSPAGPYAIGDTTVTLTCSDPGGRQSSCTGVVTVVDRVVPTVALVGPDSQSLECEPGAEYSEPGTTVEDSCTGPLPASSIARSGSVDMGIPDTYSLTYVATDAAGNESSSVTRMVVISDTQAPSITLEGPASATVECGSTYVDPGATASDSCAGDLGPLAASGSVNTAAPDSYTLSYSAEDPSGNSASASRTVSVQDTLAPQLQVREGPSLLECNGAPYVDPGATAWDLCGKDLTLSISSTSNLDQSREGQYTVTYSVTDAAGHVSTATRELTVGPCPSCVSIHLSDFNLFLLGDYNGGHDVVGKVAAGGNITMTDFAVGTGLPDNDISNTLVAGGNLTISRGGVWGHAFYGGTYTTNPSVVFPRGTAMQGTPIDFAARFAELRSLSSTLDSMAANGTTVREVWGGVMMRGTHPVLNVFDVNASAFNGAVLWSIDAPAGSMVVVNIHGASASFGGFGISFSGGIDQHGVLYNFVDTTSITAQGFGFWGTVLAPFADVQFSNGSWDGGIYAKSLTGNAEGHINPLHDRDICQ